jgi:hypothetical protein
MRARKQRGAVLKWRRATFRTRETMLGRGTHSKDCGCRARFATLEQRVVPVQGQGLQEGEVVEDARGAQVRLRTGRAHGRRRLERWIVPLFLGSVLTLYTATGYGVYRLAVLVF